MSRLYGTGVQVHYEQDQTGSQFIVIRRGFAFTFRIRLSEAVYLADRLVDIVEEVSD